MMSKMDEIFKKVLNDRDIFWVKKEIFSVQEWGELRDKRSQPERYESVIKQKIQSLNVEEKNSSDDKEKKDIREAERLLNNLLNALEQKPNILHQMFNYLDSYGLVKCNLPSMDDYGKVIERYGISTVEQFFLDKIKRENAQHKKRTLAKVLEYVKELYNTNLSPLEMAYFVRKLDSLTTFWEV